MAGHKRTTSLLADVEQLAALKDRGITQATAFELGCSMLLGDAATRILMYRNLIANEQNMIELSKARIIEIEGYIYDLENMEPIEEIVHVMKDNVDEGIVNEFKKCSFNIIFNKKTSTYKHLSSLSKKSSHDIREFYNSFKNIEPTLEEIRTFLRG